MVSVKELTKTLSDKLFFRILLRGFWKCSVECKALNQLRML